MPSSAGSPVADSDCQAQQQPKRIMLEKADYTGYWGPSVQSGPKLPRGLANPSFVHASAIVCLRLRFLRAAAVGRGPVALLVAGEAPGRADSRLQLAASVMLL